MRARLGLRAIAGVYLAIVLVGPLALVFWSAFRHGVGPVWDAISSPDAVAALKLTLITAAIAVPANTIFGAAGGALLWRGVDSPADGPSARSSTFRWRCRRSSSVWRSCSCGAAAGGLVRGRSITA